MSALNRTQEIRPFTGLRMNAGQFLALGETRERYELVNGVVLMSPGASFRHNNIAFEVMMQLGAYARQTKEIIVVHETDVTFSEREVYRPDIVAYRSARFRSPPERLVEPPDLVVEVLSEGGRAMDLVTKRDDYSRFGVREYWVVDPQTAGVRCWRRKGRALVEVRAGGKKIRSSALPGFELDLTLVRAAAGLPPVRLRKR